VGAYPAGTPTTRACRTSHGLERDGPLPTLFDGWEKPQA
jgi:hypothetical protein